MSKWTIGFLGFDVHQLTVELYIEMKRLFSHEIDMRGRLFQSLCVQSEASTGLWHHGNQRPHRNHCAKFDRVLQQPCKCVKSHCLLIDTQYLQLGLKLFINYTDDMNSLV